MSTKCLKSNNRVESLGLWAGIAGAAFALLIAIPRPACAAGALGIVYDPTNFVQNTLTATNTIREVENQAQSYLLQQYGIGTNLQGLPEAELNRLVLSGLPANAQYVLNYQQLLQQMDGSLQTSSASLQQQYSAWSASGLTPQQYVDQESQMANSNEAYSAAGFTQAQNAMQQVNSQAAVINSQTAEVGKTIGDTSSMHLMQAQLATVTAQNQQMLSLMAASNQQSSQIGSQKAAEAVLQAKTSKEMNATYGDQRTVQQQTTDFGSGLNQAMGQIQP